MTDKQVKELENLHNLLQKAILTQEEYEDRKKGILYPTSQGQTNIKKGGTWHAIIGLLIFALICFGLYQFGAWAIRKLFNNGSPNGEVIRENSNPASSNNSLRGISNQKTNYILVGNKAKRYLGSNGCNDKAQLPV